MMGILNRSSTSILILSQLQATARRSSLQHSHRMHRIPSIVFRNLSTTTSRQSILTESLPLILASGCLLAGGYAAYAYTPLQILGLLQKRLPKEGTPEEADYIASIETELSNSSIVKKLRLSNDFVEHRMYDGIPDELKSNSLTAGTLAGTGKFTVPGIVFVNEKENRVISVVHCGIKLCGFPGIVHGGLLGTILDESLARASILPLPGHSAVTANLNINYRSPTFANQIIVVDAKVTEFTSNKAMVFGVVKTDSGKLLAEASSVFVVPKKYRVKSLKQM
ncbi:HotDog domain-containing protein [Dipodascopsis uninucleata]